MKTDLHPTYHAKATIRCSCGNEFTVGSTAEQIDVEVCSNCHPFYTGKQKLVDAGGRIDRFKKRIDAAAEAEQAAEKLQAKRAKRRAKDEAEKKPADREIKLG
ncbi:MAG: 50S ribosomal protein L31 [Candidatus Andersenbacteria bacterium CG10_big_fil_rev_8_21_14_0_10_54_11]|uniref:Large ribosomal subunit protein bL31 n=1 Tax=Candidatus Andersenbacteria bacterium CG10_big_fil_rev_8_21_14_0_10_54_11 TaxID=1974485 RepID=A0A2M6WZY5_9BACT|nr:MAG: 50S ribosomal protein L31 [Candidatus Andersenbacteria bacterium CG10_big_fil_rev_8_21_14_0_10_54_11]